MAIERTLQLKLMVSEEEMQTVRALAEADGVSVADYVRTCIRAKAKEAAASDSLAGRFAVVADKLERLGVPKRETAKLRIPSTHELARRGFAGERMSKKGKSR